MRNKVEIDGSGLKVTDLNTLESIKFTSEKAIVYDKDGNVIEEIKQNGISSKITESMINCLKWDVKLGYFNMVSKDLLEVLNCPYNDACKLTEQELEYRIKALKSLLEINKEYIKSIEDLYFAFGNMISNYEWLLDNKREIGGE